MAWSRHYLVSKIFIKRQRGGKKRQCEESLELVNLLAMENKRMCVLNVIQMSDPDNLDDSGIINRNKKFTRMEPNLRKKNNRLRL